MCCEGWKRFGPYEWVCFDDRLRSFVDENQKVIATWNEERNCWTAEDEDVRGWAFRTPLIIAGRQHPNKGSGTIPNKERLMERRRRRRAADGET